jgi:hypothetical protein
VSAARILLIAAALIIAHQPLAAQRGGGARPSTPLGASGQGAPPTPKSDPAIDLTGTWTAVITEDWTLRMVTPKKGDYTRVPMTPAARRIADAWDPAKDEAAQLPTPNFQRPRCITWPAWELGVGDWELI